MLSSFQARRAEEKLGVIFDRVGAVRSRLNRLAWQTAVFGTLAWLIGCAALVLLTAYYTPALLFLALSVVLMIVMILGLVWTGRIVWRAHASSARAAAVADERAGLKGRLQTIVEVGQRDTADAQATVARSEPMWSYLIEDALARRDEYEPARIERRRLSRSIYGLLASALIAALVIPLIISAKNRARLARAQQSQISLSLKDLHLRPANPGSGRSLDVYADARTRRMLENMIGSRGFERGQESSNTLGRLLNRARSLADRLQNRLTGKSGRRPGLNLKLADTSPFNDRSSHTPFNFSPPDRADSRLGAGSQQSNPDAARNMPNIPFPNSGDEKRGGEFAGKSHAGAALAGGQGKHDNATADRTARAGQNRRNEGSGSSHGAGTDESSLFGAPTKPRLGTSGFEIAIRAEPAARGSKAAGQAYLPPKVETPLNPRQHPDEPIPRASIPQQDRAAIKSVFQR